MGVYFLEYMKYIYYPWAFDSIIWYKFALTLLNFLWSRKSWEYVYTLKNIFIPILGKNFVAYFLYRTSRSCLPLILLVIYLKGLLRLNKILIAWICMVLMDYKVIIWLICELMTCNQFIMEMINLYILYIWFQTSLVVKVLIIIFLCFFFPHNERMLKLTQRGAKKRYDKHLTPHKNHPKWPKDTQQNQ